MKNKRTFFFLYLLAFNQFHYLFNIHNNVNYICVWYLFLWISLVPLLDIFLLFSSFAWSRLKTISFWPFQVKFFWNCSNINSEKCSVSTKKKTKLKREKKNCLILFIDVIHHKVTRMHEKWGKRLKCMCKQTNINAFISIKKNYISNYKY